MRHADSDKMGTYDSRAAVVAKLGAHLKWRLAGKTAESNSVREIASSHCPAHLMLALTGSCPGWIEQCDVIGGF